ncbi:alpha/beta fold hydrolase [Saccharomonospora saliphila]|uniref:alpha/beta fold hydrolase n=1 Tax=Saccharomonospora saliphila TaxID=369829 RepID=UPI0003800710|nr:alpha/beta fold hydrolase [Saccharomonospora saliphila]
MRELPLVLLHAYPLDARMWDAVRPRLSGRAPLVTPDVCGLGRGRLPSDDAEPGLDAAARDVLSRLDELGAERAVLGGCSLGGYLAQAVLRLAPRRVAGLVLIDTKATADTEAARADRLSVARRAEAEGIGGWLAETMLPKLLGDTTRATRPEVAERVRGWIEEQPSAGVAWTQRAMAGRADSTAVLASAGVPAVVVVGEQDAVTPPEVARDLADAVPGAGLVTVPGAGHLTPVEQPEAVSDAVTGFLDTHAL